MDRATRRRWQRMVSGLLIACRAGERIRFLTLTTKKGVNKDINKSFDALKKRIQRAFKWKFNRYYKVKTSEGSGVLHILYRGHYIAQKWLKKAWREIHYSSIVDIREIKYRAGSKRIATYLITNYIKDQPVQRISYGWRWVWLGFCRSWENIKYHYGAMRKNGGLYMLPIKVRRSFKSFYSMQSVFAWESKLWVPNITSRKVKIDKYVLM